jgi:hypothetical protein
LIQILLPLLQLVIKAEANANDWGQSYDAHREPLIVQVEHPKNIRKT